MEDTRNFRSIYYEKVGCRSVEEKKSLEILLKEAPISKSKLIYFIKLFSVPSIYRSIVYNLILDVHPFYSANKEYVMSQKRENFHQLQHTLYVLRYIDEKTTSSRLFYAMYLLENRKLYNQAAINKESPFTAVAEVMIESLDCDVVELYFITRNFYKFCEEIESDLHKLKSQTLHFLEKEDNELFKHLQSKGILDNLPYEKWYPSIFTSVLSKSTLIRIFDKIASGSLNIVVFLFIVICSYAKYNLNSPNIDVETAVKIIEINDSEDKIEKSEVVVNKAVDLWLKHCTKK